GRGHTGRRSRRGAKESRNSPCGSRERQRRNRHLARQHRQSRSRRHRREGDRGRADHGIECPPAQVGIDQAPRRAPCRRKPQSHGSRAPSAMKHARALFSCLVLVGVLVAVTTARSEPAEIASLRAKAEKGNAIAQYNLGLAYAQGREDLPVDLTQAYVWLSLSGNTGSTRRALDLVREKITAAQLTEAHRLLVARRA